jgi:hypothetical protein
MWGAASRRSRTFGTVGFYVDDYRFTHLWANPRAVPASGAVAAIEPNFSVVEASPRAVAVWATYRKRWLARYWQQAGLRIWVDLCTAHHDIALLGVPDGWRSFATRAFDARIDDLDDELELARTFHDDATLLVYSGGKAVREWCQAHDALHVPDPASARFRPGQGTRRRMQRIAQGESEGGQ